jgi:methyl-accepting chemotaxis protein
MDQSTQQNAAMVEETSAAGQKLAAAATALSEQLAKFRFDETAVASIPTVSPSHQRRPSAPSTMIHKISAAFGGRTATASATQQWEDF